MKRILAFLLVFTMVLALGACKGEDGTDGTAGAPGAAGAAGSEIELRVEGDFVQWRLTGGTWTNLIALSAITGPQGDQGVPGTDGREVEVREIQDAAIQWRYVGEETWQPLYCFNCSIGETYDLVHGHYVGYASVQVLPDGTIFDVWLDEYFLPYNWGTVSADHAAHADVLTVVGSRGTSYYAKYIRVGTYTFTGEVAVSGSAEVIKYVWDDNTAWDIEEMIADMPTFAEYYVERLYADDFEIIDDAGVPHTVLESIHESGNGVINKANEASVYWRFGRLGWLGNSSETVKAVLGFGLTDFVAEGDLVRGTDQYWSIDDVLTGATWSDFPDYFYLIKDALEDGIVIP